MRKITAVTIGFFILVSLMAPRAVVRTESMGTFVYQGIDRHYLLHRSFGRTGPLPVVVAVHGLNGPIASM